MKIGIDDVLALVGLVVVAGALIVLGLYIR
jgi:hypothetical protein